MRNLFLTALMAMTMVACSKDDDGDNNTNCEDNLRVVSVSTECDVVPDCDYTIFVKNTETEEITEYPATGENTYTHYKILLEQATNGETVCWTGYVN